MTCAEVNDIAPPLRRDGVGRTHSRMLRQRGRRRAPALRLLCLLWLAACAAGLPQALSPQEPGGDHGEAEVPALAQQPSAPRLAPEQLPLRTRGRFITDAAGMRVKLACVNWAAHMEALLPEGLSRRPLADIAAQIADLGFNCVRLTYAVETVQRRGQPAAAAARARLSPGALAGLAEHNAWVLNASVWDVWGAAVRALGTQRLLVVADNHVSDAGWCCALGDGQRWFNEARFPVQPWLDALRCAPARRPARARRGWAHSHPLCPYNPHRLNAAGVGLLASTSAHRFPTFPPSVCFVSAPSRASAAPSAAPTAV